jgi:CelD/BcsL family acetyltransferase involved in cellulose biosynthesis
MNSLVASGTTVDIDQAGTIFATRVWFAHWLAAFGNPNDGIWFPAGQPYGPCIAYQLQQLRLGPFRLRVARAAANSHTPRFDVYGAPSITAAQLTEMMVDLRVSALVFPFLPWTSRLARAVETNPNEISWYRDDCESAPYIDCTGDWDQYLAARSKTHRAKWLSDERRALRAGARFEILSTWEEISKVFAELLEVEASGWKGRAGSAISQDGAARRFYKGLCEELAPLGKVRVFLYRRDQRIAAFYLCLIHAGTISSVKIGYREAFAKESPGQVLRLWILKWAFAQPEISTFDMLGPATENKLRWATGTEDLYTLYVFRSSPGGLIARTRWAIGPAVKHRIRQLFAIRGATRAINSM